MSKLIKIEPSHCSWLESSDECFYFMEYHSRQGYKYSYENNLIFNFKKGIHENGQSYKEQAITQIAQLISSFFNSKPIESKSNYIFIPIPTSKTKTDPDYDNRLIRVLKIVEIGAGVHYSDVLNRASTIESLHYNNKPRQPLMHKFNFKCDGIDQFANKTIILFDDLITSGSTYNAAKNAILENIPSAKIVGLFIAKSNISNNMQNEKMD